jgi:hypothetical protein
MGCGFSSAREAKDSDNAKDYANYSNGRAASAGKGETESLCTA